MAVATIANHMARDRGDGFVAASIPILASGGVVGFIIGLVGKTISVKRKHDA